MNLVEGQISGDTLSFGRFTIPLDRERRPRFAEDGRVIVGVRPEAFEDAEFATRSLPQIEVTAEVVEELGSDSHVFFAVEAQQVVIEDALSDSGEEETGLLADEDDRAMLVARVDSRTTARVGQPIRLAVDPSRLYFFSPSSGESLLNGAAAFAAR
jgi:multiple sugar transport system ATP-binding protein